MNIPKIEFPEGSLLQIGSEESLWQSLHNGILIERRLLLRARCGSGESHNIFRRIVRYGHCLTSDHCATNISGLGSGLAACP